VLVLGAGLFLVLYLFKILLLNNIILMIAVTLLVSFFSLFNFINMPKLQLLKRGKEIDVSLLFALRHMLIKVKSGIPLFDSMVGIAYGDYGVVSSEFKKMIRDIEGGTNEIVALEKIGFHNPSSFFRRFVWQMTNSLRAGTDVAKTLEVIVKSIEDERYLEVKAFGSRLSPIALMYIMFTIIVPALGTTFLTVFSSFFGGAIPEYVFYFIPVILLFSNLLFMNIIGSTRPMFEMN
ncbi:MAG: type II secretion system F family protein, partial [Nanoarchaeota archaeon]|nr:type II secretion system F family protein [Nanoarchaeota archaeon]